MEAFTVQSLTFTYPNAPAAALRAVDLTVRDGEFVLLCGKSGCGKSTLLRLLKPPIAPHGTKTGRVLFRQTPTEELDLRTQAAEIGFVMQSCENQIVTDKVWHELAFGAESLGLSTAEIRTRVSEMASFFGIQTWFHKKVSDLSGGQKQLLSLASVMVMQPSVLILDEPTAQLDPIAAQEFLQTLEKINRELGTTVILSEHRLEEAFPMADRVVVMDSGQILVDAPPTEVGTRLFEARHEMCMALPTPMRVHGAAGSDLPCPLTVREGRQWLETAAAQLPDGLAPLSLPTETEPDTPIAAELRGVHFRYAKHLPDVLSGLSLAVHKGELFAILGGNGVGKTTALSCLSGLLKPYRGEVRLFGQPIGKIPDPYREMLGVLPQNPQSIFAKTTVLDELAESAESNLTKAERQEEIRRVLTLCHLEELTDRHPYDLSGGEQQRAALAKVLLRRPQILLLDEPTKGMDAGFKAEFAEILNTLRQDGVTVVMVSHDVEFCARYASRCAMMFDGSVTACGTPRAFFGGNTFYTTAAHRMARTTLPNALLPEDIIHALCPISPKSTHPTQGTVPCVDCESPPCLKGGGQTDRFDRGDTAAAATPVLTSQPLRRTVSEPSSVPSSLPLLFLLLAVPLTLWGGSFLPFARRYYAVGLLIILETLLPFLLRFEGRKPRARELVLLSVLCAIAVAGRMAFFMIPEFKPIAAVTIIAGVCFGFDAGFLVGAVSAFVSNFFFGQGPWTPWQMVALGLVGMFAGLLFHGKPTRHRKGLLCLFGFFSVLVLYGGIMNPASILMSQSSLTWGAVLAAYLAGIPFDLIFAAATGVFLWFLGKPMMEKLDRIKEKYGIL